MGFPSRVSGFRSRVQVPSRVLRVLYVYSTVSGRGLRFSVALGGDWLDGRVFRLLVSVSLVSCRAWVYLFRVGLCKSLPCFLRFLQCFFHPIGRFVLYRVRFLVFVEGNGLKLAFSMSWVCFWGIVVWGETFVGATAMFRCRILRREGY